MPSDQGAPWPGAAEAGGDAAVVDTDQHQLSSPVSLTTLPGSQEMAAVLLAASVVSPFRVTPLAAKVIGSGAHVVDHGVGARAERGDRPRRRGGAGEHLFPPAVRRDERVIAA